MALPIVVPLLAAAGIVTGIAYALTRKRGPGHAALEDLAGRVAARMPRGELAFKPDVAEGIVGSLASRFYVWPDADERRVIELKVNTTGSPMSTAISALGWALSMNKTQSILAMLTMASTTPQVQLLRAVEPGTEHLYKGPNGEDLYAVLLYQGTLDKKLAPPGSPPLQEGPVGPLPTDPLQAVRDELGGYPDLMVSVLVALQEGTDPVKLDALGDAADKVGAHATALLCHQRAADLRKGGAPPPFKPGVLPEPGPGPKPGPSPEPPPPPPGLPGLPPPAALAPGQTAIVITQTDPLRIRSAPDLNAPVIGSAVKGTSVLITGAIRGGYYPIRIGQLRGWAYGGYLRLSQGPSNPQPPGQPPLPPAKDVPQGSAIVTTKTDPLSVRSAPSTAASVVGTLPRGATVQITGPVENGFSPISYANLHGFAYTGYLRSTGHPGSPLPPPPPSVPITSLPPANPVSEGAKAEVITQSDPLSLRNGPSRFASVVGGLPKGAIVIVTGPVRNGFYPVAYGSAHGYASASYLKMVEGE